MVCGLWGGGGGGGGGEGCTMNFNLFFKHFLTLVCYLSEGKNIGSDFGA